MEYTKPMVLAQNNKTECFAAGCPEKGMNACECRQCERAR